MTPYCSRCPHRNAKEDYQLVNNVWTCVSATCIHEPACSYIIETATKTPKAETRKATKKPEEPKKKPATKTTVKAKTSKVGQKA